MTAVGENLCNGRGADQDPDPDPICLCGTAKTYWSWKRITKREDWG